MNSRYRVNEIFYSLQGEGAYAGVPMVFVRFAGCNLRCPFCDTQHEPFREMTSQEIAAEVRQYGCNTVCLTGGEPTLQLTEELIQNAFSGMELHLETNGTHTVPKGIHWVTVSPKYAPVVVSECQEIKLLFGAGMDDPEKWAQFPAQVHCLQPMDVADDPEETKRNLTAAIEYVKQHPVWRLSLQTHKVVGVR